MVIRTRFEYFIILSGILLSVVTGLISGDLSIWYALWAISPYGVYYAASLKAKSIGALMGGGILILGVDILIHIQVLYFPSSSTDSIALLILPFWQSVIIMPVGFLLGWLVEKLIRKTGE